MSASIGEGSIDRMKPALEQARAFFEPQLQALGLSEEQIRSYDLEQLEMALSTANDSIKTPEAFGMFKFSFSANLSIVMIKAPEAHFEIGILPILIERRNMVVERIKAIKAIQESERQKAGAYIDRDANAFVSGDTNVVYNYYTSENFLHKSEKDSDKREDLKSDLAAVQIHAQIEQIKRLRGKAVELIPAEEALKALEKLREPTTIGSYIDTVNLSIPLLFVNVSGRLKIPKKKRYGSAQPSSIEPSDLLRELSEIEMRISPSLEPDAKLILKQDLSRISDQISLRISRLTNLFRRLFNPAMSCDELIKNMVTKIGHKEYKSESEMHLVVVSQLVEQLKQDSSRLAIEQLDVLSDATKSSVGIMTAIEERRLVVEKLVRQDRNQRQLTVFTVTAYITLVLGIMVAFILQGPRFQTGTVAVDALKLPLIGIPWPVIVWSLIGSFAAMIHRFNRMPIHDFGDAVKWLITRPVQGAVLGSAFYLVLMAGLFLLADGSVEEAAESSKLKDEAVLILSFLVGFSDRFGDSVFNTLVEAYSKDNRTASKL
ncbi:MAG: hypothetical protein AAF716_14405 [Cyanobacteria bacterium P01_D01_bin.1]